LWVPLEGTEKIAKIQRNFGFFQKNAKKVLQKKASVFFPANGIHKGFAVLKAPSSQLSGTGRLFPENQNFSHSFAILLGHTPFSLFFALSTYFQLVVEMGVKPMVDPGKLYIFEK
jgi:hypothetical protein